MAERIINLEGQQPIYIERNEGKIYVGNHYTEDPVSAFSNESYELLDYTPTIDPEIHRDEVDMILEWIEKQSDKGGSDRLALLYGTAGIGKSIVMHDILKHFMSRTEYLVLGLKSDQMEFVDTDDLSSKMHLDRPIECVIKNVAGQTSSTGIAEIAAEEASVEYFNLQGVRISEPAAGQVVIRRQGNKVSKIFVK